MVAYQLAVIVGSRMPGFVTQWPSLIVSVLSAASGSSAYDSCQRMCESYVQPYSKPFASASWMSSSIRAKGGSGMTVMPNGAGSSRPRPIRIARSARRSSACTDSSRCSSFVSSSFVCERPRRLWTKSITVGIAGARDLGRVVQRPARQAVRRAGDLADRLVGELDQRRRRTGSARSSRSAPTRPRCSPPARTARDAASRIVAASTASCRGVEVALVEQALGGLDDRGDDARLRDDAAHRADGAAADALRRSRGSRARASRRRRARRGAGPSASSRRARPGRGR